MFSVIIPAYNAEGFIKNSITSVLNQTNGDFELIIIDDGSTDATAEIIKSFSDKRIRYIYQQNGGVSSARNKGVIESKGEYICFLDADDEWRENHLEVVALLIKKYRNAKMFVTGYDIRLANGEITEKSKRILRLLPNEDFECDNGFEILNNHGYFLNTNTVCCEKEVFNKVGLFAEGVKNGEDDDMWYRLFAYYNLAISKKATTVYNRANCGATAKRGEVFETFFLKRVEDILKSPEVSEKRKNAIIIWKERNKLSRARKYILAGNKKEALKIIKTVNCKKVKNKKLIETLIALILPYKLTRKVIDKRDADYYR